MHSLRLNHQHFCLHAAFLLFLQEQDAATHAGEVAAQADHNQLTAAQMLEQEYSRMLEHSRLEQQQLMAAAQQHHAGEQHQQHQDAAAAGLEGMEQHQQQLAEQHQQLQSVPGLTDQHVAAAALAAAMGGGLSMAGLLAAPLSASALMGTPTMGADMMGGDVSGMGGAATRPTSIPRGQEGYSRKAKSLSLLCENFVSQFGQLNNQVINLDNAASQLGVERRRIYDIVNVLESIKVVSKLQKNQ